MELNAELLESIILARADSLDVDQTDVAASEELTDSTGALSSHRREIHAKGSLRLNPAQLAEVKAAAGASGTPRMASARDSSEKLTETPRLTSTPRGSNNLTPRGSSSVEESKFRKGKTLFDTLGGKHGLDNAMRWFESNALPIEREMSEAQFIHVVLSLTKFVEWEAYEIFDILGTHGRWRSILIIHDRSSR